MDGKKVLSPGQATGFPPTLVALAGVFEKHGFTGSLASEFTKVFHQHEPHVHERWTASAMDVQSRKPLVRVLRYVSLAPGGAVSFSMHWTNSERGRLLVVTPDMLDRVLQSMSKAYA